MPPYLTITCFDSPASHIPNLEAKLRRLLVTSSTDTETRSRRVSNPPKSDCQTLEILGNVIFQSPSRNDSKREDTVHPVIYDTISWFNDRSRPSGSLFFPSSLSVCRVVTTSLEASIQPVSASHDDFRAFQALDELRETQDMIPGPVLSIRVQIADLGPRHWRTKRRVRTPRLHFKELLSPWLIMERWKHMCTTRAQGEAGVRTWIWSHSCLRHRVEDR
ncbi:hypothetical protein B0H10DRAFT_2190563 [Mycena sp. CBHHK59/15]|nr:hypothetical protein B0H10DRAFT_2190563 [Mycena sp. CBHHK59/15]